MVAVIPKEIKDAWDSWNIRGMIILSLSLQTILIFFAPTRKRTSNRFLTMLLWSSYLLADLSANFAVALIAKNQGKDPKPNDPPHDKKLVALWAPFLLLHLGGPDTITAFSLEDNALWTRHFLGLIFQALAGVYVVVQSLPNVLWAIILFLFIAGTSKYLERTIALYLASSDKYRGSMLQMSTNSGFDYTEQTNNLALASEMYMKENTGQLKSLTLMNPEGKLTPLGILQHAFFFFNNFKSLMVNNIFNMELRNESKAFFRKLKDEEALGIVEAELDFIYEGLYTKGAVLHSWVGVVSRLMSLGSLLWSFIIFHYRHNKIHEFHKADIVITYTLFLVGIALDVISIKMFVVSDWTTAILAKLKDNPNEFSMKSKILNCILYLKGPKWKTKTCREGQRHEILNTPFLLKRWTGSIKMFNFISYSINAHTENIHIPEGTTSQHLRKIACSPFSYANFIINTWSGNIAMWFRDLHQQVIHHDNISPEDIHVARSIITNCKSFGYMVFFLPILGLSLINSMGITDLLRERRLVRAIHSEPLTKNLWSSIFSELKETSQKLDSLENTNTKASARRGWASSDTQIEIASHEMLLRYIIDVDYDHSLLIWHIATELCYQEEASNKENCDTSEYYKLHSNREISKILSEYMLYLLINKPKLMTDVVGIGRIRFRDTLAEAKRFFKKMNIGNSRDVELACRTILSVDTSIEPRDVQGYHNKSVLFEASSVAKELHKLGRKKWEILRKVWLEFLFHAASRSDGTTRLELLSKGGELINFVWLLMAHFGIGD